MSKFKVSLCNILKSYIVTRSTSCQRYLYIFPLFDALRNRKPSTNNQNDGEKLSKYWIRQTIPEIVSEADKLFDEDHYMEVYEMLNRLRFTKEVEVLWRIARVLYKMSKQDQITEDVQWEMTEEAYTLLEMALSIGQSTPVCMYVCMKRLIN